MSKTRAERELFVNSVIIGMIIGLVTLIAIILYLTYRHEHNKPRIDIDLQSVVADNTDADSESVVVVVPSYAETTVEPVTDPHVLLQQIQGEVVYLSPELVQQEAQMPEFGYDYEYVLRVVAAECRGEPYEGQLAVAQCIYNTAERKGLTPEEVVKAKNQYAPPVSRELVTESIEDACCAVFVMGECVTDAPIQYFYSVRDGFVSKWHENNLEFVMQIGYHKFFAERS